MATIFAPTGCQTAGSGKILAATAMQPLRIWDSLLNSLCAAQERELPNAPKFLQGGSSSAAGGSFTFVGG